MAQDDTNETAKTLPKTKEHRVLRVDQVWSRKLKQYYFPKTSKEKDHTRSFNKYALVVRRIISSKGLLAGVEVDIRSTILSEALLEIFDGVPGLKLTASPPCVFSPYEEYNVERRILFHAYSGLKERLSTEKARKTPDQYVLEDLQTALDFLDNEFSSEKLSLNSLEANGDITYDLLWALFAPHVEGFTKDNMLSEPQAFRFVSGEYVETQQGNWYEISGHVLNHDGVSFGWGRLPIKIPQFEGSIKITDLAGYPFRFHHDQKNQQDLLRERGQSFLRLLDPALKQYQGQAVHEEIGKKGPEEKQFFATGRIMVDPGAYYDHSPNQWLVRGPSVLRRSVTPESLSDDDKIFCFYRILGFSFIQKRWAAFAVSKMTEVKWNPDAFEKLILAPRKREVIKSLVQSHGTGTAAFDDIVSGKGKGLVGLLSGGPGVGKTLTAEVVAELSKRPLYRVTAGELGSTMTTIDAQLRMVFNIGARWGCVVLIDEADVFLHKRGDASLERNALCSIFLRRLEYFEGVLLLTTNRRKDIDKAFKSRIHFSFHYPELQKADRIEIWKTFLTNVSAEIAGGQLRDEELEELAEKPMNGREIKNTVFCATSIVRTRGKQLTVADIKDVLETLMDEESSEDNE